MTTTSISSSIAHTSDATFQAWAQEVESLLLATGLVLTADTGQVDLATMLRPAINVDAGYRVYRTNDGLVNLYIKVFFGTTNVATGAEVTFYVATGTDGAGNLTGTQIGPFPSPGGGTNTAVRTSYSCGVTGCWWVSYQPGAQLSNGYPVVGWMLARFCDATGAPTNDGFIMYGLNNPTRYTQQVTLQPVQSIQTTNLNCSLLPSSIQAGNVGADIQFWKHYTAQPRMTVNPFVLTCDNDAVAAGSIRAMTVAGASRNYINPGGVAGFAAYGVGAVLATKHALMLVWQ